MSRMSVKLRALSDHPLSPSMASIAADVVASHHDEMPPSKMRRGLQALGGRVTALRIAKGWTRTTLARRAQITVATVRACETGAKATHPDKLRAIALALGVPLRKFEA